MTRSLSIFVILACAACDTGGSAPSLDEGGIGGSGITRGVITVTGSATVADTTYDTDQAEVERDGQPAAMGEFFVGEKVSIEGFRTGNTGVADRVVFDDEIEGPIDAIDPADCEVAGTPVLLCDLTILGQTVQIERGVTVFDGVQFETVAVGDLVEISGFRDGPLSIVATRLDLVEAAATCSAVDPCDVELKGKVAELMLPAPPMPGSFEIGKIGGTQILFDGATLLVGFEDPIDDGDFVEVEGVFDGSGPVDATGIDGIIELEDPALEGDLDALEIEGIVSEYMNDADFLVDGQPVDASGPFVFFEPSNGLFVANGVRVEVEGRLENGVLIAQEVKFRDPEVRISAAIADATTDVDAAARTLVLLGAIDIEVDASTRFDDFGGLNELMTGDFLEVRGIRVGDLPVRATRIKRKGDVDDVEVRGRVEGFDGPAGVFTILGLDIETDAMTDFDFEDFPGVSSEDDFYAFLSANPNALLEVKDDEADGDATTLDVADEVELEDD